MNSNKFPPFSLLDKLKIYEASTGTMNIACIFRYASWFFISIIYIIGPIESPMIFKAGVIVILYIFSRVISKLYDKYKMSLSSIKILVLVETLAITLLTIPTSGLDSPFIWYVINPILVAINFSLYYLCWSILMLYIISASHISYTIFNWHNYSLAELLYNHLYIVFILVLFTLVVQLLSEMIRQLRLQACAYQNREQELMSINSELQEVNERLTEAMSHIFSLYQVLEDFNTQNNLYSLPQAFADYAACLTKANLSFFWLAPQEGQDSSIALCGKAEQSIKEQLKYFFECTWENTQQNNKLFNITISEQNYLIAVVRSSTRHCGFIGIQIDQYELKYFNSQYGKTLTFLSELSSVVIERVVIQEISDHMMIIEEQNRIANEMHDSVTQHLFSIVCSIHAVAAKCKGMERSEIEEKLTMIKESANTVMQELRSTIYKLSSKKKGQKVLFSNLKAYFDSISALNGIVIDLNIKGDEELLSFHIKKALYRILCEASGNSIRHGKCSRLIIDLNVDSAEANLVIKDDGQGFDPHNLGKKNLGLGIYNMKSLILSFRGAFEIRSKIGKGTEIMISIPLSQILNNVEGGIL